MSETQVGLLSVSQDTIRKINRVLYRERVTDRFHKLQECERDDLVSEVVLSILGRKKAIVRTEDCGVVTRTVLYADTLDDAIRRGVRRWKASRDLIRSPQNTGRSVKVRQFHDIAEMDNVTELVACAMSEAMGD
jgi:hypothetical protein